MNQNFRFVGISHKDSPLCLREKLAFQETKTKEFFNKLKEVYGISEAMVVSTCNRTEIYFSSEQHLDRDVMKLACLMKEVDFSEVEAHLNTKKGTPAIEHLFKVSLGLDAKVLGDIQIINQVKNAYQWSADEDMAGPFMHRLMHTIFFANKRVIQETTFRDGSGSVASVAVSLISTVSGMLVDPRILLIGTGEIGQNVLENLGDFTDVTIINRTRERAETLASERGYRVADFEMLDEEVNKADVVIAAISSDQPLLQASRIRPSLTQKLLIDLSVPRVIDESVESVQGVVLYNIDQIEERATEVLESRKLAVGNVENILQEQIADFKNWSDEMAVSPTIQLLKDRLEQIRQEELARYIKKTTAKEYDLINSVTKSMIQKVIKLPVLELKAACKRGEADTLVEALNDIFNLEKTPEKKS